jgi:glycosyltransferase involved in cell wall biosynthesis
VTALVPSFNHGKFLRQRIESIVNQTYKNVELIVIDDRSEDHSDEVITSLLAEHEFTYIRNARNSGTPFAAWGKVLSMATGEYIWVCESDDFAEPHFLETAVASLTATEGSVLFYCNSHVVDDTGQRVDNTLSYFHDIWKETRWDAAFAADGPQELVQFQLRGQIVPNMSSAVISTAAFRNAYRPFLKRLKLTGDWLFVGDVLAQGRVVYNPDFLSNFRRHEVTSRVRVKSARSQAEFILTKYLLFRDAKRPVKEFVPLMANDAIRFLHEPASFKDVLTALLRVSWLTTFKCAALLGMSVLLNREYPTKFFERYERVKGTS